MNQHEIWLPIAGFEGRYEVSNFGDVRAVPRIVKFGRTTRHVEGKSIYQHPVKNSGTTYLQVTLWIGCSPKTFKVHRLVLDAFQVQKPPGMQARHLDGNSLNNRASNLCWGTPLENTADRTKHGTGPVGARNPKCKLSPQQVAEIRNSESTALELASRFSVTRESIYNIRKGATWNSIATN